MRLSRFSVNTGQMTPTRLMNGRRSYWMAVMVKINNIYYMLAYAFRSLSAGDIINAGAEEFENLHELFAEIIINGMMRQLKRGLPRQYVDESEELANLRGKIDMLSSVRELTMNRRHMICVFSEFTQDTPYNRLIKCAITHLLRQGDVSPERKHYLKYIRSSLNSVSDVSNIKIPPMRQGDAEYITLVNICRFLLDGLLMNDSGGYKMREWLKNEAMSSLYERFLLQYFRKHHPRFNARAAMIDWDAPVVPPEMPAMKSDVYLTYANKTLIIDAKLYSKTMSEHFGKKKFHSNNLYQIYTYVKNADVAKNGGVSGMLLYAKTDEDTVPDSDVIISGNVISVKTLDLTQDFGMIRAQLEQIPASCFI